MMPDADRSHHAPCTPSALRSAQWRSVALSGAPVHEFEQTKPTFTQPLAAAEVNPDFDYFCFPSQ